MVVPLFNFSGRLLTNVLYKYNITIVYNLLLYYPYIIHTTKYMAAVFWTAKSSLNCFEGVSVSITRPGFIFCKPFRGWSQNKSRSYLLHGIASSAASLFAPISISSRCSARSSHSAQILVADFSARSVMSFFKLQPKYLSYRRNFH